MTKFLGFATPRSGTAWLSNFLTYGEASYCRHEALYGCGSIEDYIKSIELLETPVKGSIDTAAVILAPAMVKKLNPLGYRFFLIVRDMEEVRTSLATINSGDSSLPMIANGLDWIVRSAPWMPVIKYSELFTHSVMRGLWKYLEIPAPYPVQRFEMLREILVEDGRIKGFGRFATDEGCKESVESFRHLVAEANTPPHMRHEQPPKAIV